MGKAIPYGVYDFGANSGFVSVGVDPRHGGVRGGDDPPLYATATELRVTADEGGSNAAHSRLWKVELKKLADDLGRTVRVCHFPPGTNKWNTIEYRLFSHISIHWRGRPLTSLDLIVRLIGATTTITGLVVKAHLDRGKHPTGPTVSDGEMAAVRRVPTPSTGNGPAASS